MKEPFAEHDCVELVSAIVADGVTFPVGTVGTIVSVYPDGKGYAVEFDSPSGNPVIATLFARQLRATS